MIHTETALGFAANDLYRRSLSAGNDLIGARGFPRVAVLLIGDGRDVERARTVDSFIARVTGYRIRGVVHVDDRAHGLGFAGAIEAGWAELRQRDRAARAQGTSLWDYVFHLEEDWEFLRPVDMRALADVLDADATVAQVALTREPVNEAERAAGGVVQAWPEAYEARDSGMPHGSRYLRHSLFWTTNPSLYRAELVSTRRWPQEPQSEAAFTRELLAADYRFAYLGDHDDPPYLRHTGERRGRGY